ncbi:MAG: SDR family NAD(P)-dependent oxidoreductase, partial [Pseudomonadota bacterium]|nr:SDR family NAD(P)-dependent oxidoreductase [Pseudomonadota bacterium]
MKLENEIALISGASRGIGKAIALELGKDGAVVIGTDTSEGGAEAISKYLNEHSIKGKG